MQRRLRIREKVATKLMGEGWFTREFGSVPLYRITEAKRLSVSSSPQPSLSPSLQESHNVSPQVSHQESNESRETLGNTRDIRIIEKNDWDSGGEEQGERDREGERDTSRRLYRQSVEPEVSQEEEDRLSLQKTLMSIENRMTAMEGGMESFKGETLERINPYLSSIQLISKYNKVQR